MKDFLVKTAKRLGRRNTYILGGVLLFIGLATTAIRMVKGKRLTRSTVRDDGFVDESPQDLANKALLPLDIYSLARVIASEAGSSKDINEKLAIGWVAKNEARYRGKDLVVLITSSQSGNGRYGKQWQGRFVGSSLDPYEQDADIARKVISSTFDPTGGAVRFFNPGAQRQLNQQDPTRWPTPDTVLANRQREGFVVSTIIGGNIFFRRV